jgi:hypothetical protein
MDLIQESYQVSKDIFDKHESKIRQDIDGSAYKLGLQAVYFTQKEIDQFLTAISYLASLGLGAYYYAIQANMRLIYEHFMVGHYIWTKIRLDENDDCGQHYDAYYRMSELLKQENYDLQVEGYEKDIKGHANPHNLMKRLERAAVPITPKDISEVHTIAAQFDIRRIIDFLLNKVPEDDRFASAHRLLPQFVREYNRLSSFVHNGPSAQAQAFEGIAKPVNKEKSVAESLQFGKICARLLKENLLILLMRDRKEYVDILAPIMQLKQKRFGS